MRLSSAVLLVGLLVGSTSACSDDGPDVITPVPEDVPAIPEEATLALKSIDFGTQLIAVGNTGSENGEATDLRVCQNQECSDHDLGDIDFGTIATIEASDVGGIDLAGGEIALFDDVAGESVLISYIAWGEDDHANMELAVDQDKWKSGDTVPLQEGDIFVQAGSPIPDKASDWSVS